MGRLAFENSMIACRGRVDHVTWLRRQICHNIVNNAAHGEAPTMPTVRVPERTHRIIQELAGAGSQQEVLAEAVEDLRRKRLIEATNAAYAALKSDPAGWAEAQAERAGWDVTLGDGLEDESSWPTPPEGRSG
jgi:hypothetical protein